MNKFWTSLITNLIKVAASAVSRVMSEKGDRQVQPSSITEKGPSEPDSLLNVHDVHWEPFELDHDALQKFCDDHGFIYDRQLTTGEQRKIEPCRE